MVGKTLVSNNTSNDENLEEKVDARIQDMNFICLYLSTSLFCRFRLTVINL